MSAFAYPLEELWKRRSDVVHAFGLVLYTDTHVNLRAALREPEHWCGGSRRFCPGWPILGLRLRTSAQGNPSGWSDAADPGSHEEIVRDQRWFEFVGALSDVELPVFAMCFRCSHGNLWAQRVPLSNGALFDVYASLTEAVLLSKIDVSFHLRRHGLGPACVLDAVPDAAVFYTWQRLPIDTDHVFLHVITGDQTEGP